jgi:hypothetical protein
MCKSIFVNLGGGGGGSVNTGVLQIAGGVALDSTLRFVEDQNGTDSLFKLATNKAEFYLSAAANIKVCDGGNFLDFSDIISALFFLYVDEFVSIHFLHCPLYKFECLFFL